jgi:hypothetical protein
MLRNALSSVDALPGASIEYWKWACDGISMSFTSLRQHR